MNAIITAATGYNTSQLQVFLNSVERHCKETKVFMIVYEHDRETITSLKNRYQFLEIVPIPKKNKYLRAATYISLNPIIRYLSMRDYFSMHPFLAALGRYPLHIAIERYFIALEIVRSQTVPFSNILLTDSRDVVIQSDPFDLVNKELISGLEECNLGDSPINSGWIKRLYSQKILNEMTTLKIICSGVTLGSFKGVENYLVEMCKELWRCLPQLGYTFIDQGVHNYLIFSGKVSVDLTNNREGLIATLGLEDTNNVFKEPTKGLLRVHDGYPAIVHQYDRYPDLVEFLGKSFKS